MLRTDEGRTETADVDRDCRSSYTCSCYDSPLRDNKWSSEDNNDQNSSWTTVTDTRSGRSSTADWYQQQLKDVSLRGQRSTGSGDFRDQGEQTAQPAAVSNCQSTLAGSSSSTFLFVAVCLNVLR